MCRDTAQPGGELRQDKNGAEYKFHRLTEEGARPAEPSQHSASEVERADPDTLDKVYREVLSQFGLLSDHRNDLFKRGLTDEVIGKRGYRSFPHDGTRYTVADHLIKRFGIEVCQSIPGFYDTAPNAGERNYTLAGVSGLLIPVCDVEGRITALKIRADEVRDGTNRYTYMSSSSKGGAGPGSPVHVPMLNNNQPHMATEVRITEGELKADVSTLRSGILTISFPGVSNWRVVLPVLKQVGARTVRLAFDRDALENPHVGSALKTAYHELVAAGYAVKVETWPSEHKGIDDALAAGAEVVVLEDDDGKAYVENAAGALTSPKERMEASAVDLGPYAIQKGRFVRFRGDDSISLCNFTAQIKAEEVRDDGAERRTFYRINGSLFDGSQLSDTEVSAEQFPALNWVSKWGARAIISAGMSNKDHLRAAIQTYSTQIESRIVYAHLGWRKVGGHWLFLHSGGGLGENGNDTSVAVNMQGQLTDFLLLDPPNGSALAHAVRESLKLGNAGPDRIGLSLLATTYLAPLDEVLSLDFCVFVHGLTGTFKSTITGAVQAHFGAKFRAGNLPANWSSTANALERIAFVSKDCVLTIDDFCPKGGSREVTEIHGKAERVIRAIGNKQGRARMNASAELKATYFPRGMVLCSGEDIPKGTSLRARMWNLPLKPGDIPKTVTAELQKTAQDGILAQAMAGYVQWLAPQLDHLKYSLPKRFLKLRSELSTGDAHGRTPEIEAKLLIGLETGLRFAVECGAIGDAERADYLSRARRAFGSLVEHQAELQTSEDPVTQFFPLLRSAISSGRAHLAASKTAQNAPENPGRCGWRVQGEVLTTTSDTAEMTWEPRGNRIGWATPDEVWLDPHAAYAAVCSLARDQGESVPMTQQVLWRRLRERKLILATEQGKNTLKRTICGNETRVLVVRAEIFWDSSSSPKAGETGETREQINSSDDLVPHSAPPLAEEQGTEIGEKTLSVRSDSPGSPNSPVLRTQGNSFSALPLDFNDPTLCGISKAPERGWASQSDYERKTQ